MVVSVKVSDTDAHSLQIVDMSSSTLSVTITGKASTAAPDAAAKH